MDGADDPHRIGYGRCNAVKHRSVLLHDNDLSHGTVLAFDYGERRLGVAVGELTLRIAHPLQTIRAASDDARLEQVGPLIKEWQPVLMIVGVPSDMNDNEHAVARRCRRFASQLEQRYSVPTRLVDERLTSHAAGESLAEAGVRGIRQKAMLDQVAAQHILQTYFSMRHDLA